MAVFGTYDDEVLNGDVGGVDVTLAGSKRATLSSGERIHVTEQMVNDLINAKHDDTVTDYRREAYPTLPSVSLALAPARFGEVVKAADRYGGVDDVESVEVTSGDFVLIRDRGNEDLRITTAREKVARLVDARFRLRGAVVSGRGPLQLIVTPPDQAPVRRLLARTDLGRSGRVLVETARRDPS